MTKCQPVGAIVKEHILIVDDDSQVTSFLERFFTKNGYRATGVASSAAMFEALENAPADLVVLDLILPDEDGLDAARRLQQNNDVPIIMLSARNEMYDRIIGLELGADDYVTKPYEPRELLARVRTVLRRRARYDGATSPADDGLLCFGDLMLNPVEGTARRASDSRNLNLTSTEFALLKALADADGKVVSRDEIVNLVYGNAVQITDRAIDTHMVRLRRKLSDITTDRELIVTVHGKGYRLAAHLRSP